MQLYATRATGRVRTEEFIRFDRHCRIHQALFCWQKGSSFGAALLALGNKGIEQSLGASGEFT